MYRAIADYRAFIAFMMRNEHLASFAGMLLGSLWSFVFPITQVLIYYFLVHVIFGRGGISGIDPFLMIVIGIMHYTVVSQILSCSCSAILNRSDVLLHVRVEPAVFTALEYFKELRKGVQYLAIMLVCYVYFAPDVHWGLVAYPFLVIALVASLWGACLILSVSQVFYRDTGNIVRTLSTISVYLCPTIYHFTFVPEKYWFLYFLNPLAGYFSWIQWSLLSGPMPPLWSLAWAGSVSLIVFALGQRVYRIGCPNLTKRF